MTGLRPAQTMTNGALPDRHLAPASARPLL